MADGWVNGKFWDCSYCNTRDNAPLATRCRRCHREKQDLKKEKIKNMIETGINWDKIVSMLKVASRVLRVLSLFVPQARMLTSVLATLLDAILIARKELTNDRTRANAIRR